MTDKEKLQILRPGWYLMGILFVALCVAPIGWMSIMFGFHLLLTAAVMQIVWRIVK